MQAAGPTAQHPAQRHQVAPRALEAVARSPQIARPTPAVLGAYPLPSV